MEGLIIKILSDKCYIKTDKEVIVCTIRGKFRSLQLLPLVGDRVIINEKKKVIEEILPRRNMIRRPAVSNITQAIIVTSFKNPDFSTNLIDKILIELEFNNIKPIICLTKKDLLTSDELDENQLLYSESHGRYLMTVKADALDDILSKIDVDVNVLGEVKGNILRINENEFSIEELKDSYYGVIEKYMA